MLAWAKLYWLLLGKSNGPILKILAIPIPGIIAGLPPAGLIDSA
jgi:hypothetical protein